MTEAADADNADAVGGFDTKLQQRVEHGGTGAEQRADHRRIKIGGHRNRPRPVRTHPIGETAVAADDGRLRSAAQLLRAADAGRAVHAAALVPADADALAEFEAAHLRAHAHDFANHLVARHERVAADAPIVIDQRLIGMAHTAVFHGDLNVLFAQGAGIVAVALQRGAGGGGGPAVESCRFAVAHGDTSGSTDGTLAARQV